MSVPDPRHRGGDPSPAQLSRYLRTATDPEVRRRRWVVGLSLLGAGIGQVVGPTRPGSSGTCPTRPSGRSTATASTPPTTPTAARRARTG